MEKAVEYVVRCMNFDGGFGRVPGSESHAGQVREIWWREGEREYSVCVSSFRCTAVWGHWP